MFIPKITQKFPRPVNLNSLKNLLSKIFYSVLTKLKCLCTFGRPEIQPLAKKNNRQSCLGKALDSTFLIPILIYMQIFSRCNKLVAGLSSLVMIVTKLLQPSKS